MVKRDAALVLISIGIWAFSLPVLGQPASWLDRSLSNWNRDGKVLPALPEPATQSSPQPESRCREEVRQPTSAAERAVVRRGWKLYGPVQSYETTMVFTALAGFDGMCRPLGYQAFLYSEGRYAGTLSPVPMNSRTDGSLTRVHLGRSTAITAEFARYRDSDPLCCPSRTSTVEYRVRNDEIPDLAPVNVTTRPLGQMPEQTGGSQDRKQGFLLSGKRWILSAMREYRVSADKPYIEFDQEQYRISGDSGCNRFFGNVQITGASLKISQLGSTKRACLSEDANRLENEFLQTLGKTTRFSVETNELHLFAGESLVLTFVSK